MTRLLPVLALSLLLPACAETPGITSHLTPYRIDVRQGNLVTQDMVAQLKPGQTRDQVRFILGTPLVTDMFHADRWDYVYRFEPGRGEVQQRHLIVYFKDSKLLRLDGDVVTNQPPADEPPIKPASRVIDIPAPEAATPAVAVPAATAAPTN